MKPEPHFYFEWLTHRNMVDTDCDDYLSARHWISTHKGRSQRCWDSAGIYVGVGPPGIFAIALCPECGASGPRIPTKEVIP